MNRIKTLQLIIDNLIESFNFNSYSEDFNEVELVNDSKINTDYNKELINKLTPIIEKIALSLNFKIKSVDVIVQPNKIDINIYYFSLFNNIKYIHLSYNINLHLFQFVNNITNIAIKYKEDNIELATNVGEMIKMCDIISVNDGWMKNKDLAKLVILSNNIKNLQIVDKKI